MISSKIYYVIGISKLSPVWVKRWCLNKILRNIIIHIGKLPRDERDALDSVFVKHGKMNA